LVKWISPTDRVTPSVRSRARYRTDSAARSVTVKDAAPSELVVRFAGATTACPPVSVVIATDRPATSPPLAVRSTTVTVACGPDPAHRPVGLDAVVLEVASEIATGATTSRATAAESSTPSVASVARTVTSPECVSETENVADPVDVVSAEAGRIDGWPRVAVRVTVRPPSGTPTALRNVTVTVERAVVAIVRGTTATVEVASEGTTGVGDVVAGVDVVAGAVVVVVVGVLTAAGEP
jgi:hypothetical protein